MPRNYSKGDEVVPGYHLVEPLGQGGFGTVWKVIGAGGVPAAVKIINLTARHAYKELRAIRRVKLIRHPNLVPITGVWLKDKNGNLLDEALLDSGPPAPSAASAPLTGTMVARSEPERPKPAQLIIAMGLGDKHLFDRLQECQEMGLPGILPDELLDYMEAAARGIDHLNSPKHPGEGGLVAITHCDIKPQNIMIVSGVAQVCDFGLARVLGENPTAAAATYAYGAPEFLKDQKPSFATDQYSLAMSYIELRTGALPFAEEDMNPLGVYNAHIEGRLDFSKVSEAELPVLQRATALNPNDRFATTLEFVRTLRRAYEEGTDVIVIQPGSELVPGYKLVRQFVSTDHEEIWQATGSGARPKALILRKLDPSQGKIQFKALDLLTQLSHPHLTEMEDYWLLDSKHKVVPEELWDQPEGIALSLLVIAGKLAGKNLLDRLDDCRRTLGAGIPLAELLGYMRQLAEALDVLNAPQHPLGGRTVSIQHRDVRPLNVLLYGETIRLGNFALARVLEGTSTALPGDHAGLALAYAAPEMFEDKVTRWTDQYSLAITYFHSRTGTLPFEAAHSPNNLREIHRQGKLDLTALPAPERDVIARATSVIPDQRYDSCGEMVHALELACGLPELGTGELPPAEPSSFGGQKSKVAPEPVSSVASDWGTQQELTRPGAPFGWNYDAEGRVVENELEQEAIRLLVRLRSAGYSDSQILAELNISGSVSPRGETHATTR